MSLRMRLTLTLLAAALPLVGGWYWVGEQAKRENLDEALQEFANVHMRAGGQRDFERSATDFAVSIGPRRAKSDGPRPGLTTDDLRELDELLPPPRPRHAEERRRPGGRRGRNPRPRLRRERQFDPRRRTDMWIYGPDFSSQNPKAPALAEELRAAMANEAPRTGMDWQGPGGDGRRVLVRLWPDTRCAYGLAQRSFPPEIANSTRILLWGAVALAGGLLLAMLIGIGPILRRIRRLTEGVEQAARTQYDTEVDASGSDELAGLGRAFNDAGKRVRRNMDSLEARERTLRAFVANTTHDVMVPLTVLQGHLVALRKSVDETADPARTALVSSGLEEAHYIGCLVQNLSTMAKLEAGEVHLNEHALDLVELANRAVARHAPLARERNVTIDTVLAPEPVMVIGDVTLLEQAVSNVINNAVRYNRDGGRVIVVLEARTGTRHFCLRVFDDGPGVSEEELARLTERSFRGRVARTRRPNGGGLGLHIARDVMERHGFAMSIGPAVWGGLEIVFEGPLAGAAAQAP